MPQKHSGNKYRELVFQFQAGAHIFSLAHRFELHGGRFGGAPIGLEAPDHVDAVLGEQLGGHVDDRSVAQSEFELSEELEPGAPVIRLSEDHTQISVGSNFNPLNYVASVSDDYDDKYTLWRDIQLSGDYDVNKEGVYHLTYYVINSQGIRSNSAKFTLTVK